MLAWYLGQRHSVMISSEGKLDVIAKNSCFRSAACKFSQQCAKDGALVNWISCTMILQYVLVFRFGLAKASSEQNMEFCGNQTMDWLYILLQRFSFSLEHASASSGSQARWRKPPPGRHLNTSPVSKQQPPRLFTNRNQNKVKIQELTESRASCENRPLRAGRLNFADEEETLWKTCKYPAIFWDCKSLC